jgi:hypothetical protein
MTQQDADIIERHSRFEHLGRKRVSERMDGIWNAGCLHRLVQVRRVICSVRRTAPVREDPLFVHLVLRSALQDSVNTIRHVDEARRIGLATPQFQRLLLEIYLLPLEPGDLVVSGTRVE